MNIYKIAIRQEQGSFVAYELVAALGGVSLRPRRVVGGKGAEVGLVFKSEMARVVGGRGGGPEVEAPQNKKKLGGARGNIAPPKFFRWRNF